MDLAPVHAAADHEGDAGVAVVGAERAVLARGPAELGGGDQHHVVEPLAEVPVERGQRVAQIGQVAREHAGLLHVRVPAAHVGEADAQTDVGFDQRGQEPQASVGEAHGGSSAYEAEQ